MEKEDLMEQVIQKFTQLGIAYQTGNGTDITISQVFLDAKWGLGKKKISYEASIYADESSRTFIMWEMTKETRSGFSFGFSSESSFQSGKTLFRKVKSIQYGLDGKAYEYDLDLGAIPTAVKETAVNSGWKFKTVLKREQAIWPPDFSVAPANSQVSAPTAKENPRQTSDEGGIFCTNFGKAMRKEALFCTRCGTKQ